MPGQRASRTSDASGVRPRCLEVASCSTTYARHAVGLRAIAAPRLQRVDRAPASARRDSRSTTTQPSRERRRRAGCAVPSVARHRSSSLEESGRARCPASARRCTRRCRHRVERDVEDAAFLLDVVGEVVRHEPVVHAEHDDVRPLHPLDPVHGRQRHLVARRVGARRARAPDAQPRLERGRVGRERRDREQRVEIVAVTRFGPASAAVERLERATEADLGRGRARSSASVSAPVAQRGAEHARGRRRTRRAGRCSCSARSRSAFARPAPAAGDALQHLAPQRAARPARRDREVGTRQTRRP